ncbi:MAG: hypothetical protein JO250_09750 [Armatimonadetes bacterium]|nr:hypothetical protein [Armatimonadota bacterium]
MTHSRMAALLQQIRDAGGQKTIRRDGADLSTLHELERARQRGRLELVARSAHAVTYRIPAPPGGAARGAGG